MDVSCTVINEHMGMGLFSSIMKEFGQRGWPRNLV